MVLLISYSGFKSGTRSYCRGEIGHGSNAHPPVTLDTRYIHLLKRGMYLIEFRNAGLYPSQWYCSCEIRTVEHMDIHIGRSNAALAAIIYMWRRHASVTCFRCNNFLMFLICFCGKSNYFIHVYSKVKCEGKFFWMDLKGSISLVDYAATIPSCLKAKVTAIFFKKTGKDHFIAWLVNWCIHDLLSSISLHLNQLTLRCSLHV